MNPIGFYCASKVATPQTLSSDKCPSIRPTTDPLAQRMTTFTTLGTTLDLTPLAGLGVRTLAFRLSSTDNSIFGMNTPAYLAIDDLKLQVSSTPGDFNLDTDVDGEDLATWEAHYGAHLMARSPSATPTMTATSTATIFSFGSEATGRPCSAGWCS